MHEVGLDVVEQALVVCDHDGGIVGGLQRVHALSHNAQRVDVEAAVGFVENAQLRLQHSHLENLVALLLAARETLVHGA